MIPAISGTTTITVTRADRSNDGYDADTGIDATIAQGLTAGITGPSGLEVLTGGTRSEYTWVLSADPADIQAGDTVTDEVTGAVYAVEWAALRRGLGLDHVSGRLRLVQGAF